MKGRFHDMLLWLSAADRQVLAECDADGEEKRFVAAGGAVLATTGMALISGTFTAHELVHVPLLPALAFGIGFAFMIMNLERYVQASIRRQANPLLTALLAAPRVALAYFMGLVITIPLMLAIFASDVNKQAIRDRNGKLDAALDTLDRQYQEIPDLQKQADQLQTQVHTVTPGLILTQSPRYRELSSELARLRDWVRTTSDPDLVRTYQRRIKRLGPRIHVLRMHLLRTERAQGHEMRGEGRTRLKAIRRRLTDLTHEKRGKEKELKKRYGGPPGFAAHIEALDHVTAENSAVAEIKRVLVIFLVAIDSLPAIMLTLLLLGRKTLYEQIQDEHERATAESAATFERRRAEAAKRDADEYFEAQHRIAGQRIQRQLELQLKMDEVFIGEVSAAIGPATERAARSAAERYIRQMDDALADEGELGREPARTASADAKHEGRPRRRRGQRRM